MSRKKHSVAYIKPNEPKFLRELKERAGYKEGPTIDTKREVMPEDSDDEKEESVDEQPVVVVIKSGDLTAEEADAFTKKREEEEANTPADLSKRIIFRKSKATEPESDVTDKPVKKKVKRAKKERAVLSFDDNDEDDV